MMDIYDLYKSMLKRIRKGYEDLERLNPEHELLLSDVSRDFEHVMEERFRSKFKESEIYSFAFGLARHERMLRRAIKLEIEKVFDGQGLLGLLRNYGDLHDYHS